MTADTRGQGQLGRASELVLAAEGRPGDDAKLLLAIDHAKTGLEQALADKDARAVGWAYEVMGRAYTLLRQLDDADGAYTRAEEHYQLGGYAADRVRAMIKHGTLKFDDTAQAEHLFGEALKVWQDEAVLDSALYAAIQHNLGALAERRDDLDGAAASLYRALRAPASDRVTRTTLRVLGRVERNRGRLEDAALHFDAALRLHSADPHPEEPERLRCILGLGMTRRAQGREQDANTLFLEAFEAAMGAAWPLHALAKEALGQLRPPLEETMRDRMARGLEGAPAEIVELARPLLS